MASGDVFERIAPTDLTSEQGPISPNLLQVVGSVQAAILGRDTAAYLYVGRVFTNGTPLSTGLTIELMLVDDPNNPGPGDVAVIGVTAVPCLTTAGVLTDPATTYEVTGSATMNATEGKITILSIALANAKLTSLAASNYFVLRIRRISSNSSDTHPGRVLLVNASVKDT